METTSSFKKISKTRLKSTPSEVFLNSNILFIIYKTQIEIFKIELDINNLNSKDLKSTNQIAIITFDNEIQSINKSKNMLIIGYDGYIEFITITYQIINNDEKDDNINNDDKYDNPINDKNDNPINNDDKHDNPINDNDDKYDNPINDKYDNPINDNENSKFSKINEKFNSGSILKINRSIIKVNDKYQKIFSIPQFNLNIFIFKTMTIFLENLKYKKKKTCIKDISTKERVMEIIKSELKNRLFEEESNENEGKDNKKDDKDKDNDEYDFGKDKNKDDQSNDNKDHEDNNKDDDDNDEGNDNNNNDDKDDNDKDNQDNDIDDIYQNKISLLKDIEFNGDIYFIENLIILVDQKIKIYNEKEFIIEFENSLTFENYKDNRNNNIDEINSNQNINEINSNQKNNELLIALNHDILSIISKNKEDFIYIDIKNKKSVLFEDGENLTLAFDEETFDSLFINSIAYENNNIFLVDNKYLHHYVYLNNNEKNYVNNKNNIVNNENNNVNNKNNIVIVVNLLDINPEIGEYFETINDEEKDNFIHNIKLITDENKIIKENVDNIGSDKNTDYVENTDYDDNFENIKNNENIDHDENIDYNEKNLDLFSMISKLDKFKITDDERNKNSDYKNKIDENKNLKNQNHKNRNNKNKYNPSNCSKPKLNLSEELNIISNQIKDLIFNKNEFKIYKFLRNGDFINYFRKGYSEFVKLKRYFEENYDNREDISEEKKSENLFNYKYDNGFNNNFLDNTLFNDKYRIVYNMSEEIDNYLSEIEIKINNLANSKNKSNIENIINYIDTKISKLFSISSNAIHYDEPIYLNDYLVDYKSLSKDENGIMLFDNIYEIQNEYKNSKNTINIESVRNAILNNQVDALNKNGNNLVNSNLNIYNKLKIDNNNADSSEIKEKLNNADHEKDFKKCIDNDMNIKKSNSNQNNVENKNLNNKERENHDNIKSGNQNTDRLLIDKNPLFNNIKNNNTSQDINNPSTQINNNLNNEHLINPQMNNIPVNPIFRNTSSVNNPFINPSSSTNPFINTSSATNPFINPSSTTNPFINTSSTTNPFINPSSAANPFINHSTVTNPFINQNNNVQMNLNENFNKNSEEKPNAFQSFLKNKKNLFKNP
ncbi:hypothetical protein DMUE_2226 [Dictyocoela muelleri]|nr:hypothetical protein DMUE_2226 [Dictyocoela muelleri]